MPTARVIRWWYSPESIGGTRIELELSSGERVSFDVDSATAERLRLNVGELLSSDDYATIERVHHALAMIRRLQRFLAHRMRSSGEIKQRLATLGASPEVIATVLELLTAHGMLDDERFAHAFVRDRIRLRLQSASAIRRTLIAKGIAPAIADNAIAAEYPNDLDKERASALAQKALRQTASASPDQRYRRIRNRLLRQGFSPVIVRAVLRELFDSAESP